MYDRLPTHTTLLHTTQFISLTTSIFLSGINFGASHLTLPILHRLDAQTVSPAAIASLYHRSARLVVPLAILSTLASALVAVQSSSHERAKWVAAAVVTFASLPFTGVVKRETNSAILRFTGEEATLEDRQSLKNDTEQGQDREEIERLLRRWRRMNLFRSVFALVGGLTAAVAVVFKA